MIVQSAGEVEYTDCNKCAEYDTKSSNGEGAIQELWGMLLGVVEFIRVSSLGQLEQFNH